MSTIQILIVSIGAVCLLAAFAAFAIAYRRGGEKTTDWRAALSKETLAADVSETTAPLLAPPTQPESEPIEEQAEPLEEAPPEAEHPAAVSVAEVQRVVEVSPEEAGVTRRQFFNRALLSTWGGYLGLMGLSMLAFAWPKISGGFGSKVDAGAVEDIRAQVFLPDGSVQPLFIPDARAYIMPFDEAAGPQFEGKGVVAGGLTALWQKCVHLGCRVPWCSSSQGFECPCHGSKYNAVGEYQAGPAPRNLDRFVVEVTEDGRFIIDTGSVIQTARATVKTVPYPQGPNCVAIGG
ncbi:MAG: Rieske 2Fe-2S domain-containing protein [Acidimicrobiia bacterium]|nr:Rieske 2Fe-2S domain-containing protein [Acidimicrobiia bacterium]MDH3397286.1 Rieske 2Fe-2S domain-containing protein [Acidimicrobiia bacterium]